MGALRHAAAEEGMALKCSKHPIDGDHELRHRARAHLLHHPRAVDLDRLLGDPQRGRHLLVQPSGNDQGTHLRLPRRERAEAPERLAHELGLLLGRAVAGDPALDRIEQRHLVNGFLEIVDRASPDRAHAARDVPACRDADRRHRLALRIEPVEPRENARFGARETEYEAGGVGRRTVGQVVVGRREGADTVSAIRQQPLQAAADAGIAVHDRDQRTRTRCASHHSSFPRAHANHNDKGAMGNVVPRYSRLDPPETEVQPRTSARPLTESPTRAGAADGE
jgi:hypothetical protein